MTRLHLTAIALSIAVAAPLSAQSISSPGNARSYPLNDTAFEVVATGFKGSGTFWCGASRYAQRVLQVPWNTQISISRSLGSSEVTGRKSAVQFTVMPASLGIEPFRSSDPGSLAVGDTYSVSQASTECEPIWFRP
ncbi:MAG: hypothetical protein AAGF79_17010 [Pseudomonadota bacterium]